MGAIKLPKNGKRPRGGAQGDGRRAREGAPRLRSPEKEGATAPRRDPSRAAGTGCGMGWLQGFPQPALTEGWVPTPRGETFPELGISPVPGSAAAPGALGAGLAFPSCPEMSDTITHNEITLLHPQKDADSPFPGK